MVVLLAVADRVPNEQALTLAPVAGWLLLAAATALAVLGLVYRDLLRQLWFRLEDPRPIAGFRIAFGICCLGSVNGLWELFEYLFTDEGLFTTEVAREVFASEQFAGFGNGLGDDPQGFFDARAVMTWLAGPRYSLLFFWDSPGFFWAHLAGFELAMGCLIVGWQTRWTKWVAWFLFLSIIGRNNVYWEGTENVYRTFFFYLCLARCDRAYSVDNWLRRRRAQRRGDDSTPIHRLIPAWPRLLVILQCAAIYCYTGAVKNGAVWWAGDALYYALSLDHFHRVPPQPIAAILGTNVFRLATHVVHAWETLFPLLIIGLWIRFAIAKGLERPRGTARWVARFAWLALASASGGLIWWLLPVHHAAVAEGPSLAEIRVWFVVAWITGTLGLALGFVRLRDRPPSMTLGGRTHVLDLGWFCRWFLGRRVWVTLGVVFHLHLIILMNIGWFSPGCLTGFLCFFGGRELVGFARALRRRPRDDGGSTLERHADIVRGRDGRRLPLWAGAAAIAVLAAGVALRVHAGVAYGWVLLCALAIAGVATWRGRRQPGSPSSTALAYGPLGRLCVGAVGLYHVVGVAVWLLPEKDSLAWRAAAQRPFSWWLRTTQTSQSWKMFAPNPPRRSVMLRVLVTDDQGQRWDMNTDVYAAEKRPIPWIWYTRERKINRRIAGGEGSSGGWYRKWHARYWCRRWIVEHAGVIPHEVELIEVSYPIPTPEWLREHGPYDPVERLRTKGTQKSLLVVECATEPEARPNPEIMARRGLPAIDDPVARWSALRQRLRAWKRRAAAASKAKSDDAATPDD